MTTHYFTRAAGAGIIAATLAAAPAAATTDASIGIDGNIAPLLTTFAQPKDLNACIITAVLDNSKDPTDPRYREEKAELDHETAIMISALHKVKGGHTVGPGVIYNASDETTPRKIEVGYSWRSAVKPGEKPDTAVPAARDTFTIVTLDAKNLDGYTSLEVFSGPKASKKIEKEMKQQALYTAGQIIDCMKPFRLPPIPAIK